MFQLCAVCLLVLLSLTEVNAQLKMKTVSVQLAMNNSGHAATEGKNIFVQCSLYV